MHVAFLYFLSYLVPEWESESFQEVPTPGDDGGETSESTSICRLQLQFHFSRPFTKPPDICFV